MTPRFDILVGDSLAVLQRLPDKHWHCAVTSPPYWALRTYSTCRCVKDEVAVPDCPECAGSGKLGWSDDEIGWEKTIDEWVSALVVVFRELRRVLRDDATFFLNVGDSYRSGGRGGGGSKQDTNNGSVIGPTPDRYKHEKQLVGQAWRLAFGLQSDGWVLRSDIVWHKSSPMPESVTDRPTRGHEYIFLFAKKPRYFWDSQAISETADTAGKIGGFTGCQAFAIGTPPSGNQIPENGENYIRKETRNCRSVWTFSHEPIGTMKYPLPDGTWKTVNHFAAFPTALPERCIKAGTSERGCCANCGAPWRRGTERLPIEDSSARGSRFDVGKTGSRDKGHRTQPGIRFAKRASEWCPGCSCNADTVPCRVIDPFSGAASTGVAALRLGREYTGIELNPDYAAASEHRLRNPEAFDDPVGDAPTMELFA